MIPCPGPRAGKRGKWDIRPASLGVLTLMPTCTREPEGGAVQVALAGVIGLRRARPVSARRHP